MLMVGKILESFQRIGSGKIQAATGAEEAGLAAFGAFIHQGGAGNRSRRQLSQWGFFARIVRLPSLIPSKIGKPAKQGEGDVKMP